MSGPGKVGEKPIIAFLGPKASYTHQATLDAFNKDNYTLSPQVTIEDVFSAVQNNEVFRGVVPFENSTNGSVVFTLDLFADLQNKYPDILVCGESYIAVRHCLLGHSPSNSGSATSTSKNEPVPQKPAPKPVSDLSNIKKIYSHPQVWGQCKAFLNTYLKGIERQDVSSTSRAAELVSEDESGESVAISSVIAAQIHGLDVLAQGIEDSPDNTTRFFVIRKAGSTTTRTKASQKVGGRASFDDDDEKVAQKDSKDWKTLISFTVDHANPGSLAHSLSVFEKYGLNLTSINTRPSGVENWNYIFLVEIKGRKIEGTEDDEDGDVNRALRDLDGVCGGRRWLGSWENRLVR